MAYSGPPGVGGVALPWAVLLLYGLLFLLVFVPNPNQPADFGAQIGALAALTGSALLIAAYVRWAVPAMRTRAAAAGGSRRSRRPGSH